MQHPREVRTIPSQAAANLIQLHGLRHKGLSWHDTRECDGRNLRTTSRSCEGGISTRGNSSHVEKTRKCDIRFAAPEGGAFTIKKLRFLSSTLGDEGMARNASTRSMEPQQIVGDIRFRPTPVRRIDYLLIRRKSARQQHEYFVQCPPAVSIGVARKHLPFHTLQPHSCSSSRLA